MGIVMGIKPQMFKAMSLLS